MQLRAKKSFCQIEQLQKAVQTIAILSRWLWCWCDLAYAYVGTATAAGGDDNNADAFAIAFDADINDVVLATDDGDVGDDGDDVHEAKWAGGQPLSQQQDLPDQTTTSTITG